MNYAEIGNLFINSVKNPSGAASERFIHLTEGLRQVCARVDVRELETTDETIMTTDGQDYVVLPSNVFSVIQVDDITHGLRIQPEPSGMRGRSQYLDADSGKPSDGNPQWYDVTGQRMYLRPTPNGSYQLRIRYKMDPGAVDDTMLDQSPPLPEHLHMAVVYAASISFLNVHPDANEEKEALGATLSMLMQQTLDKKINDAQSPKQNERFDQSGRLYMPGFSRFRSYR